MENLLNTLTAMAAKNHDNSDFGAAVRKELEKHNNVSGRTYDYVLECPICGQLHSFNRDKNGHLLSEVGKCMQVQCASSFSDGGCKNMITITTQKSEK